MELYRNREQQIVVQVIDNSNRINRVQITFGRIILIMTRIDMNINIDDIKLNLCNDDSD